MGLTNPPGPFGQSVEVDAALPASALQAQMISHAVHAMSMVRDLPRYAHDSQAEVPDVVRAACLEAFFMNVRLIAEFLVRTPKKLDFSAASIVGEWTTEESAAVDRLRDQWWIVASRHVAHFSRERIAADPAAVEYEDATLPGLEAVVADCEVVWKRFELWAGIYLPRM